WRPGKGVRRGLVERRLAERGDHALDRGSTRRRSDSARMVLTATNDPHGGHCLHCGSDHRPDWVDNAWLRLRRGQPGRPATGAWVCAAGCPRAVWLLQRAVQGLQLALAVLQWR